MNPRTSAALITLLFSAMTTTLHAQNTNQLTLQQAIDLITTQNKDVVRASLSKSLAEEEVSEQKEQRIPDIGFHASYARITDLTSFPNGFKNVVRDKTIPEWADLTASASLPIYHGGEIKHKIKRAAQELKISQLELEKIQSDVKIEVIATFLGIYKLMELQKLIKENIHEEEDRLREVKEFRKRGTVTTNEVLRAELQCADMQVRLLSNMHHIQVALFELKTLLELPKELPLSIDTTSLLEEAIVPLPKDDYLNKALNKDEIRIAAEKQDVSKTEVQLAKTGFFPRISFNASYAANYPNYMFFPPQANTYTFGKIGLEATWSLSGMYKNKTRVHAAHLQEAREKVNADLVKNGVMNNVFAQYSQLEDLLEQLPVMERAVVQASENYRIIKIKYLHQLALITDMVDADNSLLKARFNIAATKIDVLMKHYELRHAAGIL